jgi:hypothetical protein
MRLLLRFCALALSLLVVPATGRGQDRDLLNADDAVVDLCTCVSPDVNRPAFYRLVITPALPTGYIVDWILLQEVMSAPHRWKPVTQWQRGRMDASVFNEWWKEIQATGPHSLTSLVVPLPAWRMLASADSWLTLREPGMPEMQLHFNASPAGPGGAILSELPSSAQRLLESIWRVRGLTHSVSIVARVPPDFRGQCFDRESQRAANVLLRTLRSSSGRQ